MLRIKTSNRFVVVKYAKHRRYSFEKECAFECVLYGIFFRIPELSKRYIMDVRALLPQWVGKVYEFNSEITLSNFPHENL